MAAPVGELEFASAAVVPLDAATPEPAVPTGCDGVVPDVDSDVKNWDRLDDGPETPKVAMIRSPRPIPITPALRIISVIWPPADSGKTGLFQLDSDVIDSLPVELLIL